MEAGDQTEARPSASTGEMIQKWAQAAFAIAGTIALIIGALLYFTERRNKPRIVISPTATVVAMLPPGGRQGQPVENVLVQITINIENRSLWGAWYNCAALDIIALTGAEARHPEFPDDLQGPSLLPAPVQTEVWRNCARVEARRQELERDRRSRGSGGRINPPALFPPPSTGTRYRDFFMEPGEVATKTWEQLVPCTNNAVRLIFKLPKPDSGEWVEYESKMLIPIADVCRGAAIVTTHRGGGSVGG